MQQLAENFYMQAIPLPKSPLKNLNCYVFCDTDYNLIIDTGFNQPECKQAFLEMAESLKLDWHKTILFITHLHSDHCGLAYYLQGKGATLMTGKVDGEYMNRMFEPTYWDFFESLMHKYDLSKYGFTKDDHPGFRYRPSERITCQLLEVGARIKTGRYEFEVVDLAGHTPGQVGLVELNEKYLFCGDHILSSITPNIVDWTGVPDSLGIYLNNLRKVAAMELMMVYPAHRDFIKDYRGRIQELLKHHDDRLAEVLKILRKGRQSVSEVASQMTWDIKAKSWFDFPKSQKWFSSGEAAAHLEHLAHNGKLLKNEVTGIDYYQIPESV